MLGMLQLDPSMYGGASQGFNWPATNPQSPFSQLPPAPPPMGGVQPAPSVTNPNSQLPPTFSGGSNGPNVGLPLMGGGGPNVGLPIMHDPGMQPPQPAIAPAATVPPTPPTPGAPMNIVPPGAQTNPVASGGTATPARPGASGMSPQTLQLIAQMLQGGGGLPFGSPSPLNLQTGPSPLFRGLFPGAYGGGGGW